MASRQDQEIVFSDFSGGMASIKSPSSLKLNEYAVVENAVVMPAGAGFRSRNGNSKFNSTQMESGTPASVITFRPETLSTYWLL
jgi:hypothetical protein